jgi:UDP-glucose:(heptosyl)LPS alpha-1,3-glucosyltransferase
MPDGDLNIGFARRGYSPSGGAEAYLRRLASGLVARGHQAHLFASPEWPEDDASFTGITRLPATSAMAFAEELKNTGLAVQSDVLMSFERIWHCDVYRAGDGVHRAWLEHRKEFDGPVANFVRCLNRKHHDILRLEQALLGDRESSRVIANSQMVKDEIVQFYGYPADRIDIVRNGVPLEKFRFDPAFRERSWADLKLTKNEVAMLFVGSGWERKGLRFAIKAIEACKDPKLRLFVAGRGDEQKFRRPFVRFVGEMADLSQVYAAADIFILPTIYDPSSNGCLEALASGLPVVTTRGNGFSEIIENEVHGSVVDSPKNIAALRDAIRFWSDPARRASARPAILERASQFDIARNVDQTLAILVQAASAASASGKIRKT